MSTSLRIAIADDEPLIRRYFVDILPDMGHTVVASAENGRELVEKCRATKPDLVISDVRMPQLDGIDAAIEISQELAVPIILVSGYHDPDLIERAEATRVMAYLVKPIERADLETAIAIARKRFSQIESLSNETAELRRRLEERKLIEQAKGVLMEKAGLSEAEAHRRLQKTACDSNRKLVDIAKMILTAEPALGLFKPEQ
jgi:two-component system, response regulator PdtaR